MTKVKSSHPWRRSVDNGVYNFLSTAYIMVFTSQTFKECNNSSSYLWRQSVDNGVYNFHSTDIAMTNDQSEIITSLETIGRQMNIIVFTLDIVEYNFNPRRTSWYATVRLSRNVIHHHISGDNGRQMCTIVLPLYSLWISWCV